ncbi:membrane protein [Alicyclobacillus hesperidum subsp. aegles]|uniref:DUF2785 domain-containing protein n=1 Tax=Alicyclobacillus hesperidum TaxID=89784 RepID=UPI00222B6601|nr:DUF2785 domain-containing protein [Alicyclobacillus hesperidum]GLG02184.1 membrane protein [Alicyclobacillus hesperidum subsp. aegles]
MTQNAAYNPEILAQILENDCQLPAGTDPLAFCLALLENFGSTDARLRDGLSYSLLARLLTEYNVLSVQDREALLKVALDDRHLFYRIGESGTDSVLMRGFSILVVPLILDPDIERPQLDADLVHDTIRSVLSYAREERDRRGYISGKGWAHTIAHTADALDSCAQHPLSTDSERLEVLHRVVDLATLPNPIYFQEDDRLAFTASRILEKELVAIDALEDWLNRFTKPEGPEPESVIRLTNLGHFLRSLYFMLKWKQVDGRLIEEFDKRLRALSWYVQAGAL